MKIDRRTVLRGLGGVAVALPALEIMGAGNAVAQSRTIPKRFVFSYGGISTGAPNGPNGHADLLVPSAVGPGYEETYALRPAGDLGVLDEITVVSGLKLPWGDGASIPAGGRPSAFHFATVAPQISGWRTTDRMLEPGGPTVDQLVANAIAGDTLHKAVALRAQVWDYDGGVTTTGRLSWKSDGQGGVVGVDPLVSPKLAYESMFTGFQPDDPAAAAEAAFLLKKRKSALDLVRGSTERLLPRLGKADQRRLERHFDEIRGLETRLATTVTSSGESCSILTAPDDASLPEDGFNYTSEDQRAALMVDLMAMAFACDITRVFSFQMTFWKAYLGAGFLGHDIDMHELSHFWGSAQDQADAVAWHVKQFAALVRKLKDLPEIDGSTVLDHTAMCLTFEGGHGYDPEGASDDSSHSTENMAVLVAGGAGGLKRGHHVPAPDAHPCSVFVSAMEAVGVTGGLGEITANVPDLF